MAEQATQHRDHWARRMEQFSEIYETIQREPRSILGAVASAKCKRAGPFAVPAALRGCSVYANDLNPSSHKWLLENCQVGAGFERDGNEMETRFERDGNEMGTRDHTPHLAGEQGDAQGDGEQP